MKIKTKNLLLTIFLIFLFSNKSYAITLGSSLGFTLGETNLRTREKFVLYNKDMDSNINIGFFYKYNWNINKFIVGVEFYYNFLNVKNSINNSNFINFRYRYGTNLNIGYDISKNFSFYGIVGSGLIKYKADDGLYEHKEVGTKFRPLFGIGIGYDISISWKVNFEYNIQTLNIKISNNTNDYKFKNKLETFIFSIIYKF